MNAWFRSGRPWIWLTAGSVSISLLAMLSLILLLGWQAMGLFWPRPVYQFQSSAESGLPSRLLGEIYAVSRQRGGTQREDDREEYVVRVGGQDADRDFYTVASRQVAARWRPADVLVVQRDFYHREYGFLQGMLEDGQPLTVADLPKALRQRLALLETQRRLARELRDDVRADLIQRSAHLAQQREEWLRHGQWTARRQGEYGAAAHELAQRLARADNQQAALEKELDRDQLVLADGEGVMRRIPLREIESAWYPNRMTLLEKIQLWGGQLGRFVGKPAADAGNTTGAFPAMVGTLLLVMLMSVMVMPFGVMAAIYLHEYARANWLTRLIRISVGNLAGVPSIVYGVFGLGFFVYVLGGTLDKLFYADALPNPTFGTPGLLWASLTLALLTLPVVIVATEEGLARIPSSLRHGSLALGATRAETLWRVVLPGAAPAMITGLILAVARAAGETAPLMLVGVIKSAPLLPVDGTFPYLHPERKFMHLGFQIYDMAFQSPDSDAARPLLFATALLLILIVVGLNLAAIGLRHRLREKYRTLTL
ncbi:phosphate ABC transporter permease PstA [Acerihabitans sp. KWT182]|uniref:Phosphate transport system permease protein PstA n=1 Tax=Acerihabitans sp. KWT182 TaxID=3157919 RepID=A0AAU7Q6N2_9GAMM